MRVLEAIRDRRSIKKFSERQKVRALNLMRARRYTELATEGLVATFLRQPLWDGTVALPTPPSPQARHRIVVAEYEEYLTDDLPMPVLRPPTDPQSARQQLADAVHDAAQRVREATDPDAVARRARDLDGSRPICRPLAPQTLQEAMADAERLPKGIHGIVASMLPGGGR